jgi:hypothetical protein
MYTKRRYCYCYCYFSRAIFNRCGLAFTVVCLADGCVWMRN